MLHASEFKSNPQMLLQMTNPEMSPGLFRADRSRRDPNMEKRSESNVSVCHESTRQLRRGRQTKGGRDPQTGEIDCEGRGPIAVPDFGPCFEKQLSL